MTNNSPKNVHGLASGWIENGAHLFPLRVYYEDTDFSGVAYYGSYFRFLERGRSEYLRAAHVLHRELAAQATPLAWTVKRICADYKKPALIDDILIVHTRALDISGARIKLVQEILRAADVLLTADVEVCLVSDGKPQRIPADIRAKLERLS